MISRVTLETVDASLQIVSLVNDSGVQRCREVGDTGPEAVTLEMEVELCRRGRKLLEPGV